MYKRVWLDAGYVEYTIKEKGEEKREERSRTPAAV